MKNVLLIFLLVILIASPLHAFTLNNSAKLTFAQDDVKVNIAEGLCANIGTTDEELLSIVEDAVESFWNQTPTSRLKLKKGSAISVSSNFRTANVCVGGTNCDPNPLLKVSNDILIACNDNTTNFPNSAILGLSLPNNISGKTIVGAIVLINDRSDTRFDGKTRPEKVAIIAHEIGHAFGLGHSPVADSLMYYATINDRERLGADDMQGITYLYPKLGGGCGTIDLNSSTKPGPNYWGGLFMGFFIIGLSELVRKRKNGHSRTT